MAKVFLFPVQAQSKDAASGMRCYFVGFLKKFQPDLPFYFISRTSDFRVPKTFPYNILLIFQTKYNSAASVKIYDHVFREVYVI